MTAFLETFLGAVGASALLLLGLRYWIDKELKRHEKELDQRNALFLTRFSKFNQAAVDSIAETYSRLVDTHNAVFRFCFPDWDRDGTEQEDREKAASDAMVAFYGFFTKHQIFMDDKTIELFESAFRFLQGAMLKKNGLGDGSTAKIHVGMIVLADLTKTFPDMMGKLRSEIQTRIGAQSVPRELPQ